MKKRILGIVLSTALCFGAALGGLGLHGALYVRPDADNWRLLPWVVPAARYEQIVQRTGWAPEQTSRTYTSILCYDAQDRLIRTVYYMRPDEWDICRTDFVYHDAQTYSEYFSGARQHRSHRITTDALGREIRAEFSDGGWAVYQYEGEWEKPVETERYDASGALIEKYVQTLDEYGNVRSSETWDADGRLYSQTNYTYDARGNVLTADTQYRDGDRHSIRQSWEYDGDSAAACYREDGQTNYFRYDAQGREIYQSSTIEGSQNAYTIETVYTDITR
ncbi:MAG: hypothetical protein ACOYIE_07920 [Agathobaculum sp.]|uniref:hypothetical protein n=1 Tax=Agathobaculum sp. TaxID=2048138 RepID=UPI003D91C74C